jgi:hypothetical protein
MAIFGSDSSPLRPDLAKAYRRRQSGARESHLGADGNDVGCLTIANSDRTDLTRRDQKQVGHIGRETSGYAMPSVGPEASRRKLLVSVGRRPSAGIIASGSTRGTLEPQEDPSRLLYAD